MVSVVDFEVGTCPEFLADRPIGRLCSETEPRLGALPFGVSLQDQLVFERVTRESAVVDLARLRKRFGDNGSVLGSNRKELLDAIGNLVLPSGTLEQPLRKFL